MAPKRSTPARAATPRRAITPRRETRQTTPKTPRNPAPSLSVSPVRPPLPPLPPAFTTSSAVPATSQRDSSNRWVEQHAPFDPVFASFDATRSAENVVGHTIQSLDHCASLYYPDIAEAYGLKRWEPAKLPRMGSRGSTCYVEGTTQTSCHKKAVPAFMYSHPSISADCCPFAAREGFPSLVCRYKIDKSGHLHFGACWACSTRGNSPCPIIQLPALKASSLELSNEAIVRQMQMSTRRTKARGRSASVASLEDRSGVKRAARQQAIQDAVLRDAAPDQRAGTDDQLFADRASHPGLTMPGESGHQPSKAAETRSDEGGPIDQPSSIDAHSPIYANPSPPPTHEDTAAHATETQHQEVDPSVLDGNKVRLWAVYMQNRARSRTPSQPTVTINVADHLPPVPRIPSIRQNDPNFPQVEAALGHAAVAPSSAVHHSDVGNAESAEPIPEASDETQEADISFDTDAHRASLSGLLALPLAAAKRYLSEMEHFQFNSHEAVEALLAKVDKIEQAARIDRAAIDAVRAERDKVSHTNRRLDTKIAVISKEAKEHEAEITTLSGMIKYYEGKLEESQSERRTSDERMTEATIDRDEAIEASNNADKARLQAETERNQAQEQCKEAERQRAETDAAMDDMMANMLELENRIEDQARSITDLQAEKDRLEEQLTALLPPQPVNHMLDDPSSAVAAVLHAPPTTIRTGEQVSNASEVEQPTQQKDALDDQLGDNGQEDLM